MIRLFRADGSRKEIVRHADSNVSFLYPFRQMDVGDYFVVDVDPEKRDVAGGEKARTRAANKLESAASVFGRRNPPMKFTTKRSHDRKIITVTRTA